MSVVPIADVRALVATKLADADLQKVVDREEAWLARRIGPLTGARTLTFYAPDYRFNEWLLLLPRPTSTTGLVVRDPDTASADLGASAVRLRRNGTALERVDIPFSGPVRVTLIPVDLLEVTRAIIELCRLTLTETGYNSEQLGAYSYSKGQAGAGGRQSRGSLLASVRIAHSPFSMPLESSVSRPVADFRINS